MLAKCFEPTAYANMFLATVSVIGNTDATHQRIFNDRNAARRWVDDVIQECRKLQFGQLDSSIIEVEFGD